MLLKYLLVKPQKLKRAGKRPRRLLKRMIKDNFTIGEKKELWNKIKGLLKSPDTPKKESLVLANQLAKGCFTLEEQEKLCKELESEQSTWRFAVDHNEIKRQGIF